MHVMLYHAIAIFVLARETDMLRLYVGSEMHSCAVPPAEERFIRLCLTCDKVFGCSNGLVVDGLHTFFGQGTKVLDRLATFAIRLAPENSAWAKLFTEGFSVRKFHVVWIVTILWFFFRIQMI